MQKHLTTYNAMTFLSDVALALPDKYMPLVNVLFSDYQFAKSPGSTKFHHDFLGGLALHTAEVVRNCFTLSGAQLFVDAGGCNRIAYDSGLNIESLLVAAMLHDYCKVLEYVYDVELVEAPGQESLPDEFARVMIERIKPGSIKGTDYRMTIGHVVGSTTIFQMNAFNLGLPFQFINDTMHVMLAHHGRSEWRSPVEPKTPEAWILHAADMLSAQPL